MAAINHSFKKKGNDTLRDCKCIVEGYQSNISRTIAFDAADIKIWNFKKAEFTAFEAAQLGIPFKNLNVAVRKVLIDDGFELEYKTTKIAT